MNQPLLVVLPYHSGDFEIAKKLLAWISELGNCEPHSILLCADASVERGKVMELMDLARPIFHQTRTMIVTVPTASEGKNVWPPNVMFLAAARQVHQLYKLPFLWLEPDAIPIQRNWLNYIANEYGDCPRRFMGSIIKQVGQAGLPPEYLNGVAVYPNDAIEVFEKVASIKDGSQAFDIGSASVVVPMSMDTPIIHHFWGTKEMPPIFVSSRAPDAPKNHVLFDFIRKEAVIFHRSKDGNLIDVLRATRKEREAAKYQEETGLGMQTVPTTPVPGTSLEIEPEKQVLPLGEKPHEEKTSAPLTPQRPAPRKQTSNP